MIDVWAYDVEKADCRMFKVMRIHSVEPTETPWAFADKHEVKKPDVFRMTGLPIEKVALQLNTRAKSLLVEEYPLAERDLKREDGKWVLRTCINSLEGAGRLGEFAGAHQFPVADGPAVLHHETAQFPGVFDSFKGERPVLGRARTGRYQQDGKQYAENVFHVC